MKRFSKGILAIIVLTSFGQFTLTHAQDDIVTTAANNGSFDTLVTLLVATGLDEAVNKSNHITVFAPTDEAFAKLPKGTLKSLRKKENRDQLAAILKYHVVPKEIPIAKRKPSSRIKSAKTLLGEKLNFKREGNQVFVNDAKVIIRNIECSNGTIQVIDSVLLPPQDDKSIVGVAAKNGNFNTLLAAAKAAGLAEALSGDGPFTIFAPTDDAFADLPKGTVESLLKPENKDKLADLLKYHVVKARVTARTAAASGSAKTLQGSRVKVSIRNGKLTINDSTVTANDIEADNGIIHVIDKVLMPNRSNSHTSRPSRSDQDQSKSSSRSGKYPSLSGKEITITANWNKNVDRDGIKADVINIRCTAGGRVRLTNVQANKIITSIGGGGNVSISGKVDAHTARVSGGAKLSASKLISRSTKITVNGGGDASINATKAIDVTANGGADFAYVDTDAKITKNVNKYATVRKISKSH